MNIQHYVDQMVEDIEKQVQSATVDMVDEMAEDILATIRRELEHYLNGMR